MLVLFLPKIQSQHFPMWVCSDAPNLPLLPLANLVPHFDRVSERPSDQRHRRFSARPPDKTKGNFMVALIQVEGEIEWSM